MWCPHPLITWRSLALVLFQLNACSKSSPRTSFQMLELTWNSFQLWRNQSIFYETFNLIEKFISASEQTDHESSTWYNSAQNTLFFMRNYPCATILKSHVYLIFSLSSFGHSSTQSVTSNHLQCRCDDDSSCLVSSSSRRCLLWLLLVSSAPLCACSALSQKARWCSVRSPCFQRQHVLLFHVLPVMRRQGLAPSLWRSGFLTPCICGSGWLLEG